MGIKLSYLFFILLFIMLYSCQSGSETSDGQPPEWFTNPPRDSRNYYFTAVGEYKPGKSAEGFDSAKKNAMNEVANFIQSKVVGVFEEELSSIEKDGKEFVTNKIKTELSVVSNADVFGIKFDKQIEDTKKRRWYVLASIPQSKMAEIIEKNTDPVGYELKKVFAEIHQKSSDINSLAISNFNYKGKHYSGEVSNYLRSKISSAFTNLGYLKEYTDTEFNKYLERSGLTTRGVTVEKNDEISGLHSKVQGFVSGSYWEADDNIEIQIKVYDLRENDYVADKMFSVKKAQFKSVKLQPDNVDDFSQKYPELAEMFNNQDFIIKIWPDKGNFATYEEGEYLIPHFQANKDCYLRVFLVGTDGNAVLLFPNYYDSNNFIMKNRVYKIGDPKFSSFKLKLGSPYGTEMLVAIASTADFNDELDYRDEIPVISDDLLRGVIMQSVDGKNKEMVSQTSCTYTIIPSK